jgi:hypothetical protein
MVSASKGNFRASLVLACLWGLPGCDLIVDTSTEQCETDGDCAKKGPAFASTFCTSQKICGALPCRTSRECSDHLNEPGYCRLDGTCTRVLTQPLEDGFRECFRVVPEEALMEDEVILAGFMAPLKPKDPDQSYGLPLMKGAELALQEIEDSANGLPLTGRGPRHLAVVVCHDNQNPLGVARHLVNQVQVSAIIGPAFSQNTIDVTQAVTAPAGVLEISASATTPRITGLSNLLWRTVPSDEIQAATLARLLQVLRDATQEKSLKVAYTIRGDSYGDGISKPFEKKTIEFGFKASDFTSFSYSRKSETPDYAGAAAKVVQSGANIVLGFGTSEFATDVLPRIEDGWSAASPPPRYLLPEGVRLPELLDKIRERPALAQRILGTAPGTRRPEDFASFEASFTRMFQERPGNLAEFAYDTVYLLAYAIGITRQPRPTGNELALALRKTSCKGSPQVRAASGTFNEDFGVASQGGCVDFEGVSGHLDFGNATEAPNDIALWCPDKTGSDFVLLPTYYDYATGQLVNVPTGGIAFCQ